MTRTQAELARKVLADVLAVIDATETPSAEDGAAVDVAYLDRLEELRDLGLAYWDANEIPFVVFRPLADLVGSTVAPAFGLPRQPELEANAIRALRRHIAKRASGEPTQAQYL